MSLSGSSGQGCGSEGPDGDLRVQPGGENKISITESQAFPNLWQGMQRDATGPPCTDNSPCIVQADHHVGLMAWKGSLLPPLSRVCKTSLVNSVNVQPLLVPSDGWELWGWQLQGAWRRHLDHHLIPTDPPGLPNKSRALRGNFSSPDSLGCLITLINSQEEKEAEGTRSCCRITQYHQT